MKKLHFFILIFLSSILIAQQYYTSDQIANLTFDRVLKAKRVSEVQPENMEIYNFNVSSTTVVKIVDKDKNYKNFLIFNYNPDYSLYISTSTTFNTYFEILPLTGYTSTALINLYGKMAENSTTTKITVVIEK